MLKRMICWVLTLCVVLSLAAMPAQAADSNEETIFLFLREELQLNEAAACGVLASIEEESGFAPTAYNPAGYYGLCQWGSGRQQQLYSFCAQNGLDSASLEGQLQFMKHELETVESAALAAMQAIENTAEGAYQAGWSWASTYERCASSHYGPRAYAAQTRYWPTYEGYPLPEQEQETSEKPEAEAVPLPETRGEYVEFLWQMRGAPDPGTAVNPFQDVKPTDSFFKAVLWAVATGVVQAEDEFHPNEKCTRAEALTLLWHMNDDDAAGCEDSFAALFAGAYDADTQFWFSLKDIIAGLGEDAPRPESPWAKGSGAVGSAA